MRRRQVAYSVTLGLLLCVCAVSYGQPEMTLLNQLASKDETTREKAHEALVQEGPAVLADLFDRMDGQNKTAILWAKRTAQQIVYHSTRPGAKKERAAAEKALLQVVQGNHNSATKNVAFRLISFVGRRASVRVLTRILNNPDNREMARWALERLPDRAATKALSRALRKAKEPQWKVALINALGARGDVGAKSTVLHAIRDRDSSVRLSAITSAGRLPTSQTKSALWRMWNRGSQKEKEAAANGLLEIAEAWSGTGRSRGAESIYRRLNEETSRSLLRCAALIGLAQVSGESALPDLLAALKSPDAKLRGVAQDQLAALPGEEVTRVLVDALGTADTSDRVALVTLVGRREDPAVSTATPRLIEFARKAFEENDSDLKQATAFALVHVPGQQATKAIIGAMRGASPERQEEWISILGKRADPAGLSVISKAARSPNTTVRVAALKALGRFPHSVSLHTLRAALGDPDQRIRNAAAQTAIPVSAAFEKNGWTDAAKDLCLAAARATNENAQLRTLVRRLTALGVTEELTIMALHNGCVAYWWVSGPIPSRGRLLERDFLATDRPVDVFQPVTVDGKKYPWEAVSVSDPFGGLDLQRVVGPLSDVGVYLYAEISPNRERDVLFKIGSDDDVFCWLNGKLAHKFVGGRGWTPDQDVVKVHLRAGRNWILMKVLNMGSEWAASLHITDLDGNSLQLPQKK